MNYKIFLATLALFAATVACPILPTEKVTPTPDLNAMVNATLTAIASIPESSIPTSADPSPTVSEVIPTLPTAVSPEPATGGISGQLSYPSDFVPPLRVVAFDAANNATYFFVDTVLNQMDYTISGLPDGLYNVVSYKIGSTTLAGGYTQSVLCGLVYGCDDHTLINVTVTSGNTTTGINPGDWYAHPSPFPPMPNP